MQENGRNKGKFRVERGRKCPIEDWNSLKACMRRKFVPPSFSITHEQMCEIKKFNRIGKSFIKHENEFSRRVFQFKEKLEKLFSEKRLLIEKKERERQELWVEKLRALVKKLDKLVEGLIA